MNEISPLTFGFALGGGLLTILSPFYLVGMWNFNSGWLLCFRSFPFD